ncbi:MAG: YopX family protein [Streptococcus salivarius]
MIPKFRAWDEKNKEMFKDTFAVTESGEVVTVEQDFITIAPDYIFVDHLTIMQSTGLTDSAGKEIFEGDILKTTDYFSSQYLVEYDLSKAMFVAQEIAAVLKGEPEPLCELLNKDFTVKIIGDIHTNPELTEISLEGYVTDSKVIER